MNKNNEIKQKEVRIKRSPKDKENPYIMLNKIPIYKKNMSWKAKGILTFILGLPDDWVLHMSHLVKQSTDGEESTRTGISELVDNNYMQRYPIYENGKIKGWEYELSEWGYDEEEKIKCIKIINGIEEIFYYTANEVEAIRKKRVDKKKQQSDKKKAIYHNKRQAQSIDNTNIDLLPGNQEVGNLEVGNLEVGNHVLPIIKPTNKSLILNNNLTNQSFHHVRDSKKNTLSTCVVEGRTAEELELYFNSMEIDKLKADLEEIDALKEALTHMYYSREIKVGTSIYPASIIKSKISKIDVLHLEYALQCFSEATKSVEIKNPLMYMCSTIFNSIGNNKLGIQAKVNFDLNNDNAANG